MTKQDFDFETWFDVLQTNVLDRTGVNFRDRDSVREDYDQGVCVYDVIDDICAEYGEDDDLDDEGDEDDEGEEVAA